jgi:CheY-like chemotaxis protein
MHGNDPSVGLDRWEYRPNSGRGTILLVEDESFLREMTCEILESAGYRVLKAGAAAEAISTFDEYKTIVRLLLTDVVLPGQNGRDLATDLRCVCPKLRIIFVSGYPENVVTRQGLQEDRMFYLPKPFLIPVSDPNGAATSRATGHNKYKRASRVLWFCGGLGLVSANGLYCFVREAGGSDAADSASWFPTTATSTRRFSARPDFRVIAGDGMVFAITARGQPLRRKTVLQGESSRLREPWKVPVRGKLPVVNTHAVGMARDADIVLTLSEQRSHSAESLLRAHSNARRTAVKEASFSQVSSIATVLDRSAVG